MTLVFNTPSGRTGPLEGVQVGPADVLATFSAAYSAAGWLGGLDGVRFMLSKARDTIYPNDKTRGASFEDLVENQPQLRDSSFYILTSDYGALACSIPNANDAFGADKITQMIGMTICALAHELGGPCAVDMFMEFLAPGIFEHGEMMGALHGKLREEDLLQKLLNEGVTRGLPELFLGSVTTAGLSNGNRNSRYGTSHSDDTVPSELSMVAGLLKWIVERKRGPYFTRSGLVARIAAYLRVVAYCIGSIQLWDGFPPTPLALGPRAVILVLGGSHETDQLMTEPIDGNDVFLQLHYTYGTVGSMLHLALVLDVWIRPETLQTDFEFIFKSITTRLQVSYRAVLTPRIPDQIEATFVWSSAGKPSGSIQTRLASIHFPLLAEYVAPCYSRIATEKVLRRVLEGEGEGEEVNELSEECARFHATTAAIYICLVSRLCSTDFASVRHSTTREILSSFALDQIGGSIDRGFSASLGLNEAVGLVAIIHTGVQDLWKTLKRIDSSDRIVGWRNGMYCVLPSLLLNMKLSASSVALECKDVFYANIRTQSYGSIRDSESSARLPQLNNPQQNPHDVSQQSVIETLGSNRPWVGPARAAPAHKPLYINIERPVRFRDADICLAGRLDGKVVSVVSVVSVLASIARSVEAPLECPHDDASDAPNVLNISTSAWIEHLHTRPAGTAELPAYLAVHDSPSWVLFAAGECIMFHHSIVFECLNCAKEAVARRVDRSGEEGVVLIGYHVRREMSSTE